MKKTLLAIILILALLTGILFATFLTSSAAEEFTVGTEKTSIVLMPEDGTPSDDSFSLASTHGVSYWNVGNNGDGRSVTYAFNAPVAGDYYLAINYNNGSTLARMLSVTVNGGDNQTFTAVRNSAKWADNADASTITWGYHIVKVTLVKGENTLIVGMNGTTQAPIFSDMMLWPTSEWLTSADTYVAEGDEYSLVDSASAFDGKCFNSGNSPATVTWNVTIPKDGLYRVTLPYSTTRNQTVSGLGVTVDGVAVADLNTTTSTYTYGGCWHFNTVEVELKAGTNVPVVITASGGAYTGGVRLELVDNSLYTSTGELVVSYDPLATSGTVCSVDVSWENDDFTFNYVAGEQGAWNPADHTFADTANAGWEDDDLVVTVVNHSNAAVKVTMEVTDGDAADGLTVTSDKATETLATAEGTAVANAPKVEYTLTITGTPTESVTKVATATLTFAKAE